MMRRRLALIERHLPPAPPRDGVRIVEWRDGPEPAGAAEPAVLVIQIIDTMPDKIRSLMADVERLRAADLDDDQLDFALMVIDERMADLEALNGNP